jgi:hypothetical protein
MAAWAAVSFRRRNLLHGITWRYHCWQEYPLVASFMDKDGQGGRTRSKGLVSLYDYQKQKTYVSGE